MIKPAIGKLPVQVAKQAVPWKSASIARCSRCLVRHAQYFRLRVGPNQAARLSRDTSTWSVQHMLLNGCGQAWFCSTVYSVSNATRPSSPQNVKLGEPPIMEPGFVWNCFAVHTLAQGGRGSGLVGQHGDEDVDENLRQTSYRTGSALQSLR